MHVVCVLCLRRCPSPSARFFSHRIADYLKKYENPLRRLQDDSGEISMRIGDTLMPFAETIGKWSQVKQMVDTRVFNVVDEPKNMTIPSDEKSHIELIQLDNYK